MGVLYMFNIPDRMALGIVRSPKGYASAIYVLPLQDLHFPNLCLNSILFCRGLRLAKYHFHPF